MFALTPISKCRSDEIGSNDEGTPRYRLPGLGLAANGGEGLTVRHSTA
jgi:hypothetical protein